ncbi:OLC1v1004025C1 [Oldenlandia corymbosa var. corymbosa]|uniref:OLC1v1004025C1 n=1 Tax=Oldenlandia corymbosa var. corymbosa TaxID=529605 RepID=A0AAV1DE22_OLDCO|nr:OLC1v1004025C1 [Oldenlandia corymbosa var. corymbosa]
MEISSLKSCRLIPPIPGTGGEDSFWGFIDSDSETEDSMSPMIRPQTYRYFGALHIAFDPSQSDHYKLLYICGFWNLRFASYASDTQLWSKSRSVLDHQLWNNMTMYYKKGVFWNGDMFWVDSRLGTYCFNFEKGCAKRITASLPQGRPILEVDRHPDVIYFGVCGDSLSLVRLMDFHPLLLDIYQLELDYSRWNFKYQVDLSPLRSAPYSSMFDIAPHSAWWQRFYVLNCLMDEQLKPTELLISVRGKIISYDIQDMIVKEIADVVPDTDEAHWRFLFKWSQVFEHFETVASV